MKNKTNFKLTNREVTNIDGETAAMYGISAKSENLEAAVYDISDNTEDAELCLKQCTERNISPAELFDEVEKFLSRQTARMG